jgi:hypothetical protein
MFTKFSLNIPGTLDLDPEGGGCITTSLFGVVNVVWVLLCCCCLLLLYVVVADYLGTNELRKQFRAFGTAFGTQ